MIAKHSNTEGSYPGHIKKFLQNNKNKADNPAEKQAIKKRQKKIIVRLYTNLHTWPIREGTQPNNNQKCQIKSK